MFVIYGKKNCPFCEKAKDMLTRFDKEYAYIDVEEDQEAMDFIKSIGARSVPQIFYGKDLVGGYNELQKQIFTLQ